MTHSHPTPVAEVHEDAKSRILSTPTRPFDPVGATSASEILTRTQGTAFKGKQLGLAFGGWKKMPGDRCTTLNAMSGATLRAGLRRLVPRRIDHSLISCLSSTCTHS